ncbi:helix-turn-helix domain-containing protein [Salmonella enterica]|uniref:helix-turn-helix domain-containing protein n=1 Tax=Salmonella sp. SAL04162 TaxID=3159782 RepID=UPI002A19D77E|nr:helix-turn-helix domain-containing protein [Salmonella enterica]
MNVLLSPISDTDLRDTLRKAGLFLDCGLISLSENPSLQNLSIESFLQAQRFVGIASSLVNKATTQNQPALPSEPAVNSTTTQQATEADPATQRFAIGTRIQIARENLGMSKAALANKLDLTPECIADWEEETCPVEATYIIPLATALKCDPIWLLTGNPVDVKPARPAPVNVMKGADLANIGVRIESRRNYIEMSLNKLAEEIDTSGAMIREWETGKAIPHSDYIDKLAKALNTTVTWLMTGKHITA